MNALNRFFSLLLPGPQTYFQGRLQDYDLEDAGRDIDDTLLNAAVKIAIHRDLDLRTAGILVATARNVVQLSGFVESRYAIDKAVETTRQVRGVRAVRNDMRLK